MAFKVTFTKPTLTMTPNPNPNPNPNPSVLFLNLNPIPSNWCASLTLFNLVKVALPRHFLMNRGNHEDSS